MRLLGISWRSENVAVRLRAKLCLWATPRSRRFRCATSQLLTRVQAGSVTSCGAVGTRLPEKASFKSTRCARCESWARIWSCIVTCPGRRGGSSIDPPHLLSFVHRKARCSRSPCSSLRWKEVCSVGRPAAGTRRETKPCMIAACKRRRGDAVRHRASRRSTLARTSASGAPSSSSHAELEPHGEGHVCADS